MLKNYISSRCPKEVLVAPETLSLMKMVGDQKTLATPSLRIELLNKEALDDAYEVWHIDDGTVEAGETQGCQWRRSNSLQICSYSQDQVSSENIEEAAYQAYKTLLDTLKNSRHPELVRFWNYVPSINHGAGDAETYKKFCTGRLQAFSEARLSDDQFPAASAVGHYATGLTVIALSSVDPAQHHANPLQISAFEYPREYGVSSPSFARATTLMVSEKHLCFISGTASILGHRTVHQDNLTEQINTTKGNILSLLDRTGFSVEQIETLRVYLRQQSDLLECQRHLEALFPTASVIYFHADICRSDLLVEIECFCVAD